MQCATCSRLVHFQGQRASVFYNSGAYKHEVMFSHCYQYVRRSLTIRSFSLFTHFRTVYSIILPNCQNFAFSNSTVYYPLATECLELIALISRGHRLSASDKVRTDRIHTSCAITKQLLKSRLKGEL